MPTRPLAATDNFQTVQQWLNDNLTHFHPIVLPCDNLGRVPEKRGIYFWFMDAGGYKALNKAGMIKPVSSCYRKEIDKESYDLVYLGTAGTGKKGNSNLRERLHWHICTRHTESAICSGVLSTLRAGIGSLLSDDLILPNAEKKVNAVFEKNFKVCWIEYGDDERGLIDSDEKILIKILYPLLNIKNNPNASGAAPANPTKRYRIRRNKVYQQTRNRLKCRGESLEKQKKEKKPAKDSPSFSHQALNENDCIEGCIEFTVNKDQSIASVIRGIPGLPEGPCIVICKDSNNPTQIVYARKNGDGWRRTGTGQQNIYTYFANVDTNNQNLARWSIIQKEMIDKKIDEITVTVCAEEEKNNKPLLLSSNVISNQPNPPRIISHSDEFPITKGERINKGKTLIIIPCCTRKVANGAPRNGVPLTYFENPLFVPQLVANRMVNINNHPPIAPNLFLPAWNRYDGILYRKLKVPPVQGLINALIAEDCLDIIIISALYGVVNYDTPINNYNLVMKRTHRGFWGTSIACAINNYCAAHKINNVYTFLTPLTYYKATNPFPGALRSHDQYWPRGLQGIPNIYNNIANKIIALLNRISLVC